jgi:hypothetical protein
MLFLYFDQSNYSYYLNLPAEVLSFKSFKLFDNTSSGEIRSETSCTSIKAPVGRFYFCLVTLGISAGGVTYLKE